MDIKFVDGVFFSLSFQVNGMTCSSCIHLIESTLLKHPGVLSASVALPTKKARVRFDPVQLGPRDVIDLVNGCGFEAKLYQSDLRDSSKYLSHQEEIAKWRNSFIVSLIFGLPCMIIMVYYMVQMGMPGHQHKDFCCLVPGLSLENLLQFFLSTPVQVSTGQTYVVTYECQRILYISTLLQFIDVM